MEAALTRSGQRRASRDLIIADGARADAPRRKVRFAPIDGLIYSMPVAEFSKCDSRNTMPRPDKGLFD